MRLHLACSLLLAAPIAAQGANAPVVINEFVYDDSGSSMPDDREFVELYNTTGSPVDISGWVLDAEDTAFPTSNNADFVIPASTILAADDYYVIGGPTILNVDLVVNNPITGQPTDLWENSNEAITLRDAGGNIVDTVGYELNKGALDPSIIEGGGIWGNFVNIDSGGGLSGLPIETSWSRAANGLDTGNNGCDFVMLPVTPGETNANAYTAALPYSDNFDLGTPDSPAANTGGSFVYPHVVDPTLPGSILLGWLPSGASPQGGNCLGFWDPAGGGNAGTLLAPVAGDAVFEAYVYFDAGAELAGEYQLWSIGFGTTGTFYNSPDPGGTFGFTANGNTGVSWTFQTTSSGGVLYLIDHNDGGWGGTAATPANILGSINVTPGVNDGWQRLRLERTGGYVLGTFGGTLGSGCADGTNIGGAAGCSGQTVLYLGYREFVGNNNNDAHPVLLDAMTVKTATGGASYFGTAYPHSVGTPGIAPSSSPTIGNAGFAIQGSNLIPNAITVVVISGLQIQIPIVGGLPGTFLAVLPQLTFGIPTTATGTAIFPAPIPCNATFVGASVYWQIADFDVSLKGPGIPIPLGVSRGLDTKFSN